ncbi:MAG: D-alanyl-D-alanine carboxypeptidase family protein [Eubacteriales bacterium]|nr:D-alanyl-D-alanine carboxypeptidase family protein [Eubacteriales bacterium]
MKERSGKRIRRFLSCLTAALLLACSFLSGMTPAYAVTAWPSLPESVNAGAAICMDAETGAILYGKNINVKHYPASITKIMTALLVLENCELSDMVTFSESAVSNLEPGAVTAFTSAGDQLSVRDCLYALLFRSANEVANALAEHVAGSVEAFADLMNQRARELGCTNTHFVNPNGLNNSEHYTTAYDMALIAKACMENPAFLELETEDSHTIGSTQKRPNGLTVTLGHKMKRSGTAYSDSRVVAGKTGYTSMAGNTLVTMAEDGGRRIVAVVLQDRNPLHYVDTKDMLDLGFSAFENVDAGDLFDASEVEARLVTDGVIPAGEGANHLEADREIRASLPVGASVSDLSYKYEYNLAGNAPEDAVAKLTLYSGDHTAGEYFVINSRESNLSILDVSTPAKVAIVSISLVSVIGVIAFLLLGSGTAWHVHNVRVENQRLARMRRRRRRRLEAMGMSEEEFRALVERRRNKPGDRRK